MNHFRARFQKLSTRSQIVVIAFLWATLGVPTVLIHRALTKEYFRIEQIRLETIASTAAYSGAQLLPSNPYGAERTANAYARMNGIPARDIVLVQVADNQRSLTVELGYRIPLGFALFGWNGSKYLTVTARADLRLSIPQLEAL